ncbi:hypothetical protein [Paraburkholderia phytofirmans]|uniref:hypothetical protein n=1 Tax=Paraburkholderia phytofirmans TaxID=261302 RepID=UPI0011D13BAF|nr:hypothetical protein [Paraburkholderia phytofirmans]
MTDLAASKKPKQANAGALIFPRFDDRPASAFAEEASSIAGEKLSQQTGLCPHFRAEGFIGRTRNITDFQHFWTDHISLVAS